MFSAMNMGADLWQYSYGTTNHFAQQRGIGETRTGSKSAAAAAAAIVILLAIK